MNRNNSTVINQAFAQLERQLRFAAAQTLTKTAQAAQEEVRRQLPERFTIRTGWVSKGIRIRPASRNNLKASVLVKDSFMAQQESGGDKVSPFGDALGVPVGARPSRTAITRPSRVFPVRCSPRMVTSSPPSPRAPRPWGSGDAPAGAGTNG